MVAAVALFGSDSELCVLVDEIFLFTEIEAPSGFQKREPFKFRFVFAKPNLDNLLYNPQQLDSPEHYQQFGISERLPPERPVVAELEEERTRLGLLLSAK